MAPNTTRARPRFVGRVLRFAVPAGCIAAGATLIAYSLTRYFYPGQIELARTAATLTLSACGLCILAFLVRGSETWQRVLLTGMAAALVVVVAVAELRQFFALEFPPLKVWILVVGIATVIYAAFAVLTRTGSADAFAPD